MFSFDILRVPPLFEFNAKKKKTLIKLKTHLFQNMQKFKLSTLFLT